MKIRAVFAGKIFAIFLFLLLVMSPLIFSQPVITNVTLNPPAPAFGQTFTVTVDFCAQRYNSIVLIGAVSTTPTFQNAQLSGSGQVFLVTRRGVNVHVPAANPGEDFGLIVRGNWGGSAPANCNFCNGSVSDNQGTTATATFVLTMPNQESFPGCNTTQLYFLIKMRDSNMAESDWMGAATTCPAGSDRHVTSAWNIPLVTPYASIQKRAEGVLQNAGDLLLYQIQYEYANQGLTITDPIPGGGAFTLVQAGPMGIWTGTPPIGSTSGTLQWNLPNRAGVRGVSQGTVWFLLRMTTDIPDNTVVPNTANGVGSVSGATSSLTNITVGRPVINITKSQRNASVPLGSNVTYYLEYSINGSRLMAYQPFDDLPLGNFHSGTGPPTGWRFDPTTMTNGTWEILDECLTGDRVLRGHSNPFNYPGLLYQGLGASFCQGVIVSDIKITASYEGADSLVFIRNNGVNGPGAIAYAVGLSVDRNFGGSGAQGYIGFQRCVTTAGPTTTCIWPGAPAAGDPGIGRIETNRWYTLKVEALTDYQFRAKVWRKGDPEPAAWDITWTDTTPPANSACASTTWFTGYGQQGGDSGWVRDIYNNFVIYEPRVSASTILYDTIPAGVVYVGYQGPLAPTTTTPRLNWNLGSIANEGGTYTWWGRVDTCDLITNRATIAGTLMAAVNSNEVVTIPVCPTPVITLVKSHQPAGPVAPGAAVTWALNVCNSAAGPTANPITVWDTIPSTMLWGGWVGPAGSGTTAPGGVIWWDASPLNAGACRSYTWWGTANP